MKNPVPPTLGTYRCVKVVKSKEFQTEPKYQIASLLADTMHFEMAVEVSGQGTQQVSLCTMLVCHCLGF